MENIKKFYHVTKLTNIDFILEEGLKTGCDGCIFLADSPDNAYKFLKVRGVSINDVAIIEILSKNLDKSKLDYSYDHSESFFGCKAYIYTTNLPTYNLNWRKI